MTIFSWEGEIDTTMTPMDSIRYYSRYLEVGLNVHRPHQRTGESLGRGA
jgi:penicillin-binding protein 1A